MKTEFKSIKIESSLWAWLRVEAARRNVPMYQLIESLIAQSVQRRPWQKKK